MAAHYQHFRIDRAAVKIGDLDRILRIGKVHHRNTALIPGLDLDIAAGYRNKRTVMSNAVLCLRLGRRHFVIIGEVELTVLQPKDRIRSPNIRVICTATWAHAAAPFVGIDDLAAVIRERCRVPICIVRVVDRLDPFGIRGVFDIQQNAVTGACTGRKADLGICRDVMALVRFRRTPVAGVRTAVVKCVDLARLGIAEHSRRRNDSSFLRSLDRNLDHLDAEVCGVRIFIRRSARTSLKLLSGPHE